MPLATALLHIVDFLVAPVALGLLASTLVKLLWWRDCRGLPWWRLAVPTVAACTLVAVIGLAWTGDDGRMATWTVMIVACAAMLGLALRGGRRG